MDERELILLAWHAWDYDYSKGCFFGSPETGRTRSAKLQTKWGNQMTTKEIQSWLSYWQNAKMVAVDNILALDQVYQARKYCECMRTGVFSTASDGQIWDAIREQRKVETR